MSLIEAEIVEHHRFIEAWLSGAAERTPEVYAAFVDQHAPDFSLYGPGGDVVTAAEIAAGFEKAYGSVPGVRVEIRAVRLLGPLAAVYEEHQGYNARRSTVVFVPDPAARNGLRWRHLHETWIVSPPG